MEVPIITEEFEINDKQYGIIAIKFENAVAIYVFEGSPKFGTTALSIPGNLFSPANTLFMSGTRNEMFARMLGEKLATVTKKLVFVSVNIEEITPELHKELWKKIEETVVRDNN